MNRGPIPGAAQVDFVAKAQAAWAPAPDWVVALAEAATRDGLAEVGRRIGYSKGVVSQVISASYGKGNLGKVEVIVRGAYMAETVDCPVLGEIGRDQCRREQKTPFRATNSSRARLKRACRTCEHLYRRGDEA
jgi:hypothetical protein